jgi:hypothetical protein
MVKRGLPRRLRLLAGVFCALWLMVAQVAQSAQTTFTARVDRNPVTLNQSFMLTLQGSEDGDPDLRRLEADFEIVGQSKSSNLQIVNGSISRSVVWQLSLIARRAGQLQIPPVTLNGQSSSPIALVVQNTAQAQAQANGGQGGAAAQNGILLEVRATPQSVYVQQQVIIVARLYRAVNLGKGSSLSDPKFAGVDAMVERLGQDRTFQENKNGQDYVVIERRYVLYPQKSGQFTSDPILFDGEVVDNQSGFFSFDPFNQQRTEHVRVQAKPLSITVKPSPSSVQGSTWLPARKLHLGEQWGQNSSEPPVVTVGEPVTRTLILSAEGLNAAQLPDLTTGTLDGVKLYPDQAALKNTDDEHGASGVREQKIAMIPTRAGQLILPALKVKWWNVQTDREETTELPARTLTVLPAVGAGSAAVGALGGGGTASSTPSATALDATPTPTAVAAVAAPRTNAGWWPWLSLALGLGWLLTLAAWWHGRRHPAHAGIAVPSGVSANHAAHASSASLKQIEASLKQHCMANQAALARADLLAWGALQWPQDAPSSLTAMTRLVTPVLADALLTLDRSLYAPAGVAGFAHRWQGDAFWQVFQQQKAMAMQPAQPVALSSSALPSLYQ